MTSGDDQRSREGRRNAAGSGEGAGAPRTPGRKPAPQAAAPAGHPAWEEEEISLLDLLSVLLRHRGTIALATLLVPVLVVAVTLVSPRSWTSSTSFMPQARTQGAASRLSSLAGQFGIDIPSGESGQTPQFYADLVRSRQVLGAVADDTFSVAPEGAAGSEGASADGDEATTRPGTGLVELLEVEGDTPALRRESVIGWLREEAVSVSTGRETGVIEVSVTTPWPDLSRAVSARLIALVNEFNLETRQSQAAEERRFIEERVREARADLRAAENELETFLKNNRQFQNSPELVFQHDRLQRQVSMRQQVYNSLMQSYEQARISEVRNTPVITVVEEPEAPVRPDPRRLPLKGALGLVLGGMLGVFVAFGREYVERSREEDREEYQEFSTLWAETKDDVKGLLRRVRPREG